jgi:hypothetical protein
MSVAAWPTVGSTLGLTRFSWQTKGALGPHDRIVLEQRVTCSPVIDLGRHIQGTSVQRVDFRLISGACLIPAAIGIACSTERNSSVVVAACCGAHGLAHMLGIACFLLSSFALAGTQHRT